MFPNFLLAFLLLCSPLSTSTQEVFAYYKLALQWPISVCNVRRRCDKVISSGQEFTVHGLWPFWANHTMLEPCPGNELTKNQVKGILRELSKYWPNFEGEDFSFWSQQWEKHGRCLRITPFEYFEYTVRLAKHYRNRLLTLNRQGYTAKTEHYIKGELYAYFKQAVNPARRIQFKCNSWNGRLQLLEFYICISRNGEVLNCPSPAFINCGKKMAKIWYPDEKTLPRGGYRAHEEL